MRPAMLLSVCIAALMSCGCGLLYVPHCETFPAKTLRKVVVTDLDTGEPIRGARVSLSLHKYENWMRPVPLWTYCPEAMGPAPESGKASPDVTPAEIRLAPETAPGVYEFRTVRKWGWLQVWIPLPPVLGPWFYRIHEGTLVIETDSRGTVTVNNEVGRAGGLSRPPLYGPEHRRIDPDDPRPVPKARIEGGMLHVALPGATENTGQPASAVSPQP